MVKSSTVPKLQTFFEMIKFQHSLFALPFAYLGLLLAERGFSDFPTFFLITIAMVSFRTMGMALNRLIDKAIDAKNPRTKSRVLPRGALDDSFVWMLTFISFAIFEISTFQLNTLCFQLSWIPVSLAFLYPWAKRFTWLSHLILGIILGIAPYGAWVASQASFSWTPGFATLGVALWVCGFDIIYALQDLDFDRSAGLFSIPAKFGKKASLILTGFLHACAVCAWVAMGVHADLGWIYWVGLGAVAAFLIRENWLVHVFGTKKIGQAFFTMNVVVSISLFFAVMLDLFFGG